MKVVRTRRGWAVEFEGGLRTDDMSERAAHAHLDRVMAQRARLAADEEAARARGAELLARHGISEVDYRELKPGDLFTWRPGIPPKVVTEARHFDSGASLILWEPDRYTPPWQAMTLMVPGYPAYGCHRELSGEGNDGQEGGKESGQ